MSVNKTDKDNIQLRALIRRLLPYIKQKRKTQFLWLLVLMLVGAFAELVTLGAVVPFISLLARPEQAYDYPALQSLFANLGWEEPASIAAPMTALFLFIVIIAAGIRVFLAWYSKKFIYALGFDIGVTLYQTVLNQPYSYHVAHNTSEVIGAITKVQVVVSGVLRPLIQAVVSFTICLGIVVALILIDPIIAVGGGVGFALLYFVVTKLFRFRLSKNSKIIASAHNKRVKAVQEGLGGIRDVILDGTHSFYVQSFAKVDYKLRNAQAMNTFLGESPRFVVEALGISLIVAIAYLLSSQSGGLISALPVLGALAIGAQRMLPLTQQVYQGWAAVSGNKQALVDVLESLELPENKVYAKQKSELLNFGQEITLDDISFQYGKDNGKPVLKNINLTILKGSKIGFVGKTGSGKSTLLDLIMGLLEPTAGSIKVDGVPINKVNRYSWYTKMAHVPQNIYLTDGTVTENIAFGVPVANINLERVREAAERAQIADHIETLPDKYDSHVGERGVRLSGGQRQRIGIARALYGEAEVLVLDEATSALDSATETAVMESIDKTTKNLTVLIIAHRVETLRHCDKLIKLKNGQIEKSGPFDFVLD